MAADTMRSRRNNRIPGLLLFMVSLVLLIWLAISVIVNLNSPQVRPDMGLSLLGLVGLAGIVVVSFFMMREMRPNLLAVHRVGILTGCVLGLLIGCGMGLLLMGNDLRILMFFYFAAALPIMLVILGSLLSGGTVGFDPALVVTGSLVQLALIVVLGRCAFIIVRRGGSVRQGIIGAFIAAISTTVISTFIFSVFEALRAYAYYQGVLSFVLEYQNNSPFIVAILVEMLLIAGIAGPIGARLGNRANVHRR